MGMITEIKTREDIIEFMLQLIEEEVNVHPDDDFNTYVNTSTGETSYTTEDAAMRNNLMMQAFKVCEESGLDIYNVTQEVYLKGTGLDQYIPLP